MTKVFGNVVPRAAVMLVVFMFVLSAGGLSARAAEELTSNEEQQAMVDALGLSSEQPVRYSPSGKVVDKSKSPFGVNNLTYFAVKQLAVNLTGGYDAQVLLHKPLTGGFMSGDTSLYEYDSKWKTEALVTASVAADVDGNGTDEVVTVGIIKSSSNGAISLGAFIADYADIVNKTSSTVKTKSLTLASAASFSGGFSYTKEEVMGRKPLQAVAVDLDKDGTDEIAVLATKTLYLYKVDLTSSTQLSKTTFDSANAYARIDNSLVPAIEIASVDSDGDGFNELLVTTGVGGFGVGKSAFSYPELARPKLIIYDGSNLSAPYAVIPLSAKGGREYLFSSASIDVGDVFGEGGNRIVLAGRHETNNAIIVLTTVHFDPATESYDPELVNKAYVLGFIEFYKLRTGLPGLKCAALETLKPEDPEYIVCGGYIFRYNSTEDKFEKKSVSTATNSSGLKGNEEEKSLGSITNINGDTGQSDETYIMDTLVGSFDPNTLSKMDESSGKEQIILLHHNKWYNGEYAYVTVCSMDKDGNISAKLGQYWKKDGNNEFSYPSVCAPDIYDRGLRLTFKPEMSQFMFSNPTVMAVLSATPYYEELFDQYMSIYNVGTSYGMSRESETSLTNGISASVGVSFGFSQGFAPFGIQVAEVSFEAKVTRSFSASLTTSASVSKSLTFSGYYSQDTVVLMTVPNDVYYFDVYNTETGATSEMCIMIPYSPVTTTKALTAYRAAAELIDGAPIIGNNVIGHTIGDPRTYPDELNDLPVAANKVATGGDSKNVNENFIGAGIGNSSSEQDITLSSSKGTAFDLSTEYSMEFKVNAVGFTTGVSGSWSLSSNITITTTESTSRTGSVASVPDDYPQYEFKWCLAAYNYELPAGDGTQPCTVITYLVKPIGSSLPPKIPGNLTLVSKNTAGASLTWEPAEGATSYKIYCLDPVDGSEELLVPETGIAVTSFTDTTVPVTAARRYLVTACAGGGSVETMPVGIVAPGLSVGRIAVKTQPRLNYDEGDSLDLSALALTIIYNDGSTEDMEYMQAPEGMFTTSKENNTELLSSDSGIPVTVTFNPGGMFANTSNLTVFAASPYEFTISAVYQVGSTNNATALEAGKALSATVTVKNNTSSSRSGVVIIALYSPRGSLVNRADRAETVDAASERSVSISNAFTLPSDVSGHYLKVFVWDGDSLTESSLTPMSNILQF